MLRFSILLSTTLLLSVGCSGSKQTNPPPQKKDIGSACANADECQSGICEGQGCGDVLGVCADPMQVCSADLQPYCGCDGTEFQASGSCPGRRYANKGACSPPAAE